MKFSFKRIFSFVLAFAMVISLVPEIGPLFSIKANAATTTDFSNCTVANLGLSVDNSKIGSGNQAAPEVSWVATAAGTEINGSLVGAKGKGTGTLWNGFYYESTTVLTLKNNNTVDAELKFKYSATTSGAKYGDITITTPDETTTHTSSITDQEVTATLVAGAAVTITLHAVQRGPVPFSYPTANGASISITDLKLTVVGGMTVTFGAAENGSYTVTDASGESVTVPGSASALTTDLFTLTATPADGYAFAGWYKNGTEFLSGANAWEQANFTEDMTVTPKFIPATEGIFGVGNAAFTSLANAITAAENTTKTVILLKNHVLYGDHTIPAGITLLIPKDTAQTTPYGENLEAGPTHNSGQYAKPTASRTLTLEAGATLIVNGAVEVSAVHVQIQGAHAYGGAVYSSYGCINLAEGSEIILNDGANLYAWGYVLGDGIVTANSGATVYEKMQVTDYRGGTRTSSLITLYKGKKVFPFNQYYVQNVEAKTVLNPGSTIKAHATIYYDEGPQSTITNFIGNDAMFAMGSDTVLTKEYDSTEDRLIISAQGQNTANSTVSLNGVALEIEGRAVDSADFVLPINSNITINLDGCTATVNQELLLQPGVRFDLAEDACINVNANIYIFDADQWGNYVFDQKTVAPLPYVPGLGGASSRTISSDAVINVNGMLIANAGFYTTESGACIISSEKTGIIKFGVAASSGTINQISGHNATTTLPEFDSITAVSAVLTNGNTATTTTSTAGAAAGDIFVYDSLLDMWVKPTGDMELNYDANGGTGGPGKQVVTLDGLKGGTESNELQIPSTVPTKTNAKFLGWALSADGPVVVQPGDLVTIGQSHTLYAKWEITHYTITFLNEDGSVFETLTVPVGQTPTAGTPTKTGNAQYTYTFAGWDKEVVPATADATYTATFKTTTNSYTVTFVDENGNVLGTEKVAYGSTPACEIKAPEKSSTAQYSYTAAGWDHTGDGKVDTPAAVTGDITYKVVYTATVREYTVTWMNGDGTTLSSATLKYGAQIIEPDTNPTKAKDDTYHYTFVGWDSNNDGAADAIGTVSSDVTYVPVFTGEVHSYGDGVVTKQATPFETGVRTYTCTCGATKTEDIEKASFTSIKSGGSYQIGLIEPWFMQISARLIEPGSATNATMDYSKLLDYGAFAIRATQLSDPEVDVKSLSIQDLMNEEKIIHYTQDSGNIYLDGEYLVFRFYEGLYTYRLQENVVWVVYAQTEDGWLVTTVRQKNLHELMVSYKDDEDFDEYERNVYSRMLDLYDKVTDYRSDFEEQKDGVPQDTANLSNTNIAFGAAATDNKYAFGRSSQIYLIEPWGLKYSVRLFLRSDTSKIIDYSTVTDYGLLIYHDKNGTIDATNLTTLLDIADKENVYVFSNSQGTTAIEGEYIVSTFNKDVFTYQLNSSVYYMFYIQDGENFYYTRVYTDNIKDLVDTRAADTRYKEKERAVYTAMSALYGAITEYRDDYFARNPEQA